MLYIETVASKRVRQPVSKDSEAGVHTDTPGFGLTGMWPDDCGTAILYSTTTPNDPRRLILLQCTHVTQVHWVT